MAAFDYPKNEGVAFVEQEEVLHLLVDASFLPVVDDNQRFKGIITRKEILKAVNHMAHELEKHHLVLPKSEEEMKVI